MVKAIPKSADAIDAVLAAHPKKPVLRMAGTTEYNVAVAALSVNYKDHHISEELERMRMPQSLTHAVRTAAERGRFK